MAINLKKVNFAQSTLASSLSLNGTSFSIASGDGAKFPATGSTNVFRAVVWGASYATPQLDSSREIIDCYRSSGDTFTVNSKGSEGTTSKAWVAGDNIALVITKGIFEEYESEISAKVPLTRILSLASNATLDIDASLYDFVFVTALAVAMTINAPTNLSDGKSLLIRIKDNGTAKALSWNAIFRVMTGVSLPTTTTANKIIYVSAVYNSADSSLDILDVKVQP